MLTIEQLQFRWPGQASLAIDIPQLTSQAGQHIGLVGDNGAGKSTLLKLMAGLLAPQQGQICWQQQPLHRLSARQRSRQVGILFQEPEQQLLHSNLLDEVAVVLRQHKLAEQAVQQRCQQMLAQLQLDDQLETHPLDLDAGRRRLLTLASVLVAEPQLLLLDEPSRDFDRHHLALLEQQLQQFTAAGGTVISISHDLDFIARNCQRVWHLSQGQIIADGSAYQTLSHPQLQAPQMLPAPTLWSLQQHLSNQLKRVNQ